MNGYLWVTFVLFLIAGLSKIVAMVGPAWASNSSSGRAVHVLALFIEIALGAWAMALFWA